MSVRITNIVPLLLITLVSVCLVEGGYRGLEFYMSQVIEFVEPAKPKKKKVKNITRSAVKSTHDYKVILERNLFGPPPQEEKPEEKKSPDYPDNLEATELQAVLMGTVKGDDDANRAIILDKKTREQQLYEVGDAIQGAFIKDILRGKVVVVLDGKDEILDISEAASMRKKVRPAVAVRNRKKGVRRRTVPRAPVEVPGEGVTDQVVDEMSSPGTQPVRRVIRPRVLRPAQGGEQQ